MTLFWSGIIIAGGKTRRGLHEPEIDCCHLGNHRRAGVRTGPKAWRCEGDPRGRAKVLKITSGDKARTQTYCDILNLGVQIEEAAAA